MQKFNNWGVSYSSIVFFERAMKTHDKVAKVTRENDIFFIIEDYEGKILKTLLLDEYRFGLAALLRALEEFPDIKYIVIGGNWNRPSSEALEYAREHNIGIFRVAEFMGAINYKNPMRYLKKNENANKKDPFRSA